MAVEQDNAPPQANWETPKLEFFIVPESQGGIATDIESNSGIFS